MDKKKIICSLIKKSNEMRYKMIEMLINAKSGHPGGSLSCAEIITALYFHFLRINPKKPGWSERDRFILSKGHAAPILYVALSERGFFNKDELLTYRSYGSILQGHPDMNKTPGIDISTGSLGQGFSAAVGMTIGCKNDKKDWKVYVLLGDGEINEGQVWEAAMFAGNRALNNLIVFIDYNKLQFDGYCSSIMDLEPMVKKWDSFKWKVVEIDGHNMSELFQAIESAQNNSDKPIVIICHTIKGKGVSFMENEAGWHSIVNFEKLEDALNQLRDKF